MKLIGPSLLQLVCLVILPITVLAADVTVDSTTFLGIARRDVSGGSKESFLPATQFVGLTADKLADGNLSLHLYGWGRTDLGDNSYNNNATSGSLNYGYLQYRFDQANAIIRGGRFSVREGIVNEQIDGVSARTDLPMGIGISGFLGATVHSTNLKGENSDGKGDMVYGGRINYRHTGLLEAGLSGIYQSAAPTLVTQATKEYRRVGADIWLTPKKSIDIIGHSSFNPETARFTEHSYLINVKQSQRLVLTGEINQYREKGDQYTWSPLPNDISKMAIRSTQTGLSAAFEVDKNLEVAADYKHYTREFGSADRFGGEVRVKYKENSIRGGFGYHYLNAGQGFSVGVNPPASYHELRCYTMRDSKSYFVAIDILGDFFKNNIYGKSSAWEGTTSLGYHFTPALALSGDLSYGRNPQFTEETKALLRLTYNMSYPGIGVKK